MTCSNSKAINEVDHSEDSLFKNHGTQFENKYTEALLKNKKFLERNGDEKLKWLGNLCLLYLTKMANGVWQMDFSKQRVLGSTLTDRIIIGLLKVEGLESSKATGSIKKRYLCAT